MRAQQKNFPRSVRDRAPGELIAITRHGLEVLSARRTNTPLDDGTAPDLSPRTKGQEGIVTEDPCRGLHPRPRLWDSGTARLALGVLGTCLRPMVNTITGEIVGDTLDLNLARKAWSTGPDPPVPIHRSLCCQLDTAELSKRDRNHLP